MAMGGHVQEVLFTMWHVHAETKSKRMFVVARLNEDRLHDKLSAMG